MGLPPPLVLCALHTLPTPTYRTPPSHAPTQAYPEAEVAAPLQGLSTNTTVCTRIMPIICAHPRSDKPYLMLTGMCNIHLTDILTLTHSSLPCFNIVHHEGHGNDKEGV